MKINITGHETVLTPEARKYANKKLDKLCKHYKTIIDGDLVLEEGISKTKTKSAAAKATLHVPGPDVTASAEGKSVFAAIDELERKLVTQLEKTKSAHDPKAKKAVRSKHLLRKLMFWNSQDQE